MTTLTHIDQSETVRYTPEPTARTEEQARIDALEFVRARGNAALEIGAEIDRNRLLEQTTRFVVALLDCSTRTASTIAAQTIGEWESRRSPLSFDIDQSTSHVVFLRDNARGITRAITAHELRDLLASHGARLN